MNCIDCYWEKRNLGCSVAEISVNSHDNFRSQDFKALSSYDYLVVKVPTNKIDFNFGLNQLGFSMIELQMEMNLKIKDFNYDQKLLKPYEKSLDFHIIKDESDLNDILRNISVDMFTTDRIFVDPLFGPDISRLRYVNWIRDEFEKKSSIILKLLYNDEHIGFSMFREEETLRGLLGGIYSKYQNLGLGAITPTHLPIFVKRNRINTKKIVGDISSNNKPVWELYEYFGYKAFNPRYVFVKHNK